MRITNISNFLGGAETVIAEEVIERDQKTLRLVLTDAAGTNLNLTNYSATVGSELFQANVTNARGSVTIDQLTSLNQTHTYGNSTVAYPSTVLTIVPASSAILFKIPATLLSDLDNTRSAPADTNTPFVVACGVQLSDGGSPATIRTIRFLFIIRYNPALA